MRDNRSRLDNHAEERSDDQMSLDDGDIARLILASSLSAAPPLLGLITFSIQEGSLNGVRLKAFLEPMPVVENFLPATRAMLLPIWRSFMSQIGDPNQLSRLDGETGDDL
jgi:hypothetical protein